MYTVNLIVNRTDILMVLLCRPLLSWPYCTDILVTVILIVLICTLLLTAWSYCIDILMVLLYSPWLSWYNHIRLLLWSYCIDILRVVLFMYYVTFMALLYTAVLTWSYCIHSYSYGLVYRISHGFIVKSYSHGLTVLTLIVLL